jgi:NAD(P)-dependent dehydrogenase (short-subunit alcohol dehydrogenase family)
LKANLAKYISPKNRDVRELFSLAGKVALVTGGAGRYGKQISLALAEAGATVVIAARNVEHCSEAAEEIRSSGLIAYPLALDLTSAASSNLALEWILTKLKNLDILINNAAIIATGGLDTFSEEDWESGMAVNSTGLYRACRVFGGAMQKHGSGSIVNIGSIYGVVSPDFRAYLNSPDLTSPPSYSFAKAGIVGLTKYLAVYFAPHGVRVNCISPGGLYSPGMPTEFLTNYCNRTPLGRMAGCNDLKGPVVFFASDASAYITGHNQIVDGGLTAL